MDGAGCGITHLESELSGGRGRNTVSSSLSCVRVQGQVHSLVVEPLLGMWEAPVWSLALGVYGRHRVRDSPRLRDAVEFKCGVLLETIY